MIPFVCYLAEESQPTVPFKILGPQDYHRALVLGLQVLIFSDQLRWLGIPNYLFQLPLWLLYVNQHFCVWIVQIARISSRVYLKSWQACAHTGWKRTPLQRQFWKIKLSTKSVAEKERISEPCKTFRIFLNCKIQEYQVFFNVVVYLYWIRKRNLTELGKLVPNMGVVFLFLVLYGTSNCIREID